MNFAAPRLVADTEWVTLPRIQPINPRRLAAPFDHADFLYKLKHDGFRALAYVEGGACELISRKQNVYKSFGALCGALAALPVKDAIFDGEIVSLDGAGRSQFLDLMHRRPAHAAFYAFDLLWLEGEDMRALPLTERKRILRRVTRRRAGLLYAEHIEHQGVAFFQAICQKDLEGIVAKHRLAPYVASPVTWFKVLNPDYSQRRGRRELFEKFRDETRDIQKPSPPHA